MAQIVVGVDGSDSSLEALAWARDEATLRGCTLEAVNAYHMPATWLGVGDGMGTMVNPPVDIDQFAQYAREVLAAATEEVIGADPSFPLEQSPIPGHPADVLVDLSKDASLVVVGSRGRGDIGSVLLGSVGMHVVHHAHCPVVVVRAPHSRK